ncbi:ABC transporter [Rhizoctonia solani AG-1 IA]|uniref:ABC transporter n=1 Tax=Thanatephorus cucumeris (strain AG1-IA) TaxID=983506 RepID=L8WL93_THACA|nr:ABC transporter [Rhizoctonia solani AG-1 IA]
MAIMLPLVIVSQVEPMFIAARMTFIRESSSRMYSEFAFALGQVMAEMPYSLLCAAVYFLLFYYPAGFQYTSDRAGYQFLMFLGIEIFSVTLAQMIASLSPTILIAGLLNPFVMVTVSHTDILPYVPLDSIPKFWRAWLYQIDPFTRVVSGMVSTELHGLKITCSALEFAVFQPPQGQTCLQWAGDFVNVSVGYLDNPDSTFDCGYAARFLRSGTYMLSPGRYCPYEYGDDFYNRLGISFDTRWRDFGIVIAFTVFNIIVTSIASRVFNNDTPMTIDNLGVMSGQMIPSERASIQLTQSEILPLSWPPAERFSAPRSNGKLYNMGRWYTPFAYTSGFVLNKDEVFDLAKHVAFDFAPSPTAHELEVVVFIHNASRNIRLHMARETGILRLTASRRFPSVNFHPVA